MATHFGRSLCEDYIFLRKVIFCRFKVTLTLVYGHNLRRFAHFKVKICSLRGLEGVPLRWISFVCKKMMTFPRATNYFFAQPTFKPPSSSHRACFQPSLITIISSVPLCSSLLCLALYSHTPHCGESANFSSRRPHATRSRYHFLEKMLRAQMTHQSTYALHKIDRMQ